MQRAAAMFLSMILFGLACLPAPALAERRYVIRSGRTWDEQALNAVGRMAQRGATLRHLYLQYRDRAEELNRQRLDRGLTPMDIKSFRDWRRVR